MASETFCASHEMETGEQIAAVVNHPEYGPLCPACVRMIENARDYVQRRIASYDETAHYRCEG